MLTMPSIINVLRVKKLDPNAKMPTKAHATDAGYDLTATSVSFDEYGNYVYGTGLAIAVPEGHVGLVFPRSSISKKDLALANAVGVIDSPYRGELLLKFTQVDKAIRMIPHTYGVGEKVAQLVVIKLPEIELVEVAELEETDRGTGGFGSTGA